MTGPSDARVAAFTYLDWLRESGITNMWGAVPYLASTGLSQADAKKFHIEWMESFDPEKTPHQRAETFA